MYKTINHIGASNKRKLTQSKALNGKTNQNIQKPHQLSKIKKKSICNHLASRIFSIHRMKKLNKN